MNDADLREMRGRRPFDDNDAESVASEQPSKVAPFLGVLAQLGVILYMFLVGLDLNPDLLRGQVRATVSTAHASIALPFILGSALALYLDPRFATSNVPFTHFAPFLGIALSITAFPVLGGSSRIEG